MKKHFLIFALIAVTTRAQDLEDVPFDDLPDMGDSDATPVKKAPTPKPAVKKETAKPAPAPKDELEDLPPEEEPVKKAQTKPAEKKPADDDLDSVLDDLEDEPEAETVDKKTPEPPKTAETSPAKTPPTEALPAETPPADTGTANLTPDDTDLPDDVKKLEQRVQDSGVLSPNLVDSSDPGGNLEPSEQFHRVPLRPQMSDSNWRRWAGPSLEKIYRIRRGNTLWGVSETLFGNPFLWPKVWQLNARVTNPNVISPGLELFFQPGNPNSAPEIAFKNFAGVSGDELPLMLSQQKPSLMDRIELNLRAQGSYRRPPFKYFLLASRPPAVTKVKSLKNNERVFFTEGDSFRANCPDGLYGIIRIVPIVGKTISAYRVKWLGVASVTKEVGIIKNSYAEIQAGDNLVTKQFTVSPLAVHEESLANAKASFLPLEEGGEYLTAEERLVGARFSSLESGPREGALMKVSRGPEKIATLLLINRDGRLGTFWIVDNQKEIDIATDRLD